MKQELKNYLSELGKKGGKKTLENKGKDYFRALGRKAAKIRWSKRVDKSIDR